jgi:hypothetical protein
MLGPLARQELVNRIERSRVSRRDAKGARVGEIRLRVRSQAVPASHHGHPGSVFV